MADLLPLLLFPACSKDPSVAVSGMPLEACHTDSLALAMKPSKKTREVFEHLRVFVEVTPIPSETLLMRPGRHAELLGVPGERGVNVFDTRLGQGCFKRSLGKPWLVAPRRLTDVNKNVDLLGEQELDELVNRSLLVPERE